MSILSAEEAREAHRYCPEGENERCVMPRSLAVVRVEMVDEGLQEEVVLDAE
jgi:hypothetical protein